MLAADFIGDVFIADEISGERRVITAQLFDPSLNSEVTGAVPAHTEGVWGATAATLAIVSRAAPNGAGMSTRTMRTVPRDDWLWSCGPIGPGQS